MEQEKFTQKSLEAIQDSQKIAIKSGNPEVTDLHLHYSLVNDSDGLVNNVLSIMGVDTKAYIKDLEERLDQMPSQDGSANIYPSTPYQRIILNAEDEAKKMGDEYISVEHLYLSILKSRNIPSAEIIKKFNIKEKDFKDKLKEVRGSNRVTTDNPEDMANVLEKYGRDLTEEARSGKLDPIIGRDEEIRNTERILSRRTKNNPILIGEPGVGKTAIVEGLAQRIIHNDVPETLQGKTIWSLDMASLIAGAKYRGEFEERLKAVVDEIKKSDGQIIMFIDEIHTIVGAGASEGAMDASNILKPVLARGEVHTIGATTLKEYKQYIEKDGALERRFQKVLVDEPTVEDSISILRGIKEKYEIHHGIHISDNAVIQAVTLSDRYITDRYLPDKAIDVMDEAGAMVRTEIDSMPEDIDEDRRKILQLEIEKTALKKEDDEVSKERLKNMEKELSDLKARYDQKVAKWQDEKKSIDRVKEIREEIDQVKNEMDQAERSYDFEKLSELKYGKMQSLQKELDEANEKAKEDKGMLKEEVTEEDVAEVVSKWTGVPVSKLVETERDKILNLPETIHKRVIGQDEAVKVVSDAIIRARSGIKDEKKPIGSFIFLGPTGVGKTELAKALTEAMFDDEKNMIRIDMSEYMEKHSVSRLIGAPPGYVGYDEGGQLTEAVRRKPYSLILFDEIEKAHPDVFNILLQVLDDGRLTDNQGRTVDFKNTIIIMTSNIGSEYLLDGIDANGEITEETRAQVNDQMRRAFKPEFLNRLDEIVMFKPLQGKEIYRIIDLQIEEIEGRLEDRRIYFETTDSAKEFILARSYSAQYGARPVKRFLQKNVETPIGRMIIEGSVTDKDTVLIDAEDGRLKFSVREKEMDDKEEILR